MQWETQIIDTVQMGGVLVFIADGAPADIEEWLKPLHEKYLGQIPFVKRSMRDLLSVRYQTKPQDMIFIFSSQVECLASLNAVLQGQRVFVGAEPPSLFKALVDFVWAPCELSDWKMGMDRLADLLRGLTAPQDFLESHEAPCLFLDRDDVVVKNVPYNKDPDKVELQPGIEDLISRAHQKGYWVALVTNQSGLGRGWISWAEYQAVHQKMLALLAEKSCWIDECVWSFFIDQEATPAGRLMASLRKPRTGMFQLVNSKIKVNMARSVMVGDSASDLIAAEGAGVGSLYLLSSEKLSKEQSTLADYQKDHPSFQFEVRSDLKSVIL